MTIQTVEGHFIQRLRSPSDSARTDKAIILAVAGCLAIALVTLGLLALPGADAEGSYTGATDNVAMIGP
jgi:hypothetical protein